MCNRTPRAGERWIFRQERWEEDPAEPGEEKWITRTREGYVHTLTVTGVRVGALPRPAAESSRLSFEPLLAWSEGWEPFLCLDEGETQEHPTSTVKVKLDTAAVDKAIRDLLRVSGSRVRLTPADEPLAPQVGERWHFRNNSGPPGGFAEKYIGVVEGIGDGWTVVQGGAGPVLLGKAWKPVMKAAL